MDEPLEATQPSVGLKVCGVTRREDLQACADLGVDAVGLNFWPKSKRALGLDAARELLEGFERKTLRIVGVFVEASPGDVAHVARALGLDAVQLHGDMTPPAYAAAAAEAGAEWIRVVRGTPALEDLAALPTPAPTWTILDAAVEGFGGAGAKTDWAWAARAVERMAPAPVWLAGGITPANAAQAISQVNPAGLDVASGVELLGAKYGEKDEAKIAALVRICKNPG